MASEEVMALTAIGAIAATFLSVPCVLLWVCNRDPGKER